MSDIRIVNLSSHQSPEFMPFVSNGKGYVLNGKDNKNYQYVIDRYKYSPTNATIIDSYSNYIYGKGLTAKYRADNANQFAEVLKLISKKELKKIVKDYAVFHEASVEVILGKSGNKIVEVNHLPKNKVVPNKVDDEGEIGSYWFSYDWSDLRKYPAQEIPAFTKDTKEKRTVFIFKEYNIDEFYFARPSYFSGLNYAELEEEISIYCVNHIKNGLSAGHIINFNDGEADPEVKDAIERNIDRKLAGATNSGKRILSFNSNKENATTVEAIEISDAHQQYQFLSEEARRQLMVAHKVTSPILFGIKDNTGFGNNADEMTTAYDELMMNVIQPMQEVILDGLMELLSQNGISLELEFIPLRPKVIEPTITALSTQKEIELESYTDYPQEATENAKIALRYAEKNGWGSCGTPVGKARANQLANREPISRDTISRMASFERQRQNSDRELGDGCGRLMWLAWGGDAGVEWAQRKLTQLSTEKKKIGSELIELGEDEDLSEYELIECKPVDYEEEEKLTYKFASTGTANPNRKSIYDNDFYIFRYRYAGNPNPEREFCKNMMSANKIYRREDIEAMGEVTVNAGFGMHPTPNKPYSIWLYKGGGLLSAEFTGGTCKHYWEKLTYKKKDVKIDPKSPIAIDEAKKDRASGIAGIAPHEMSFIKRIFYNENRDELGRFAEGDSSGGESSNDGYNIPSSIKEGTEVSIGQKIDIDKYPLNGTNKKIRDNVALALDLSDGADIRDNIGKPISRAEIMQYGYMNQLNSVYFKKNGVEYRVSNHELPNRRFKEKHNFTDPKTAIKNGVSTKDLFYENNVEIIVKDGKISKINRNFNF